MSERPILEPTKRDRVRYGLIRAQEGVKRTVRQIKPSHLQGATLLVASAVMVRNSNAYVRNSKKNSK